MRKLTLILFLLGSLACVAQEECAVEVISTLPTCPGDADGSLTVVGDIGPYFYTWVHDPALTTGTASALIAGEYIILVSGPDSCESVLVAELFDPIVAPLGTMTTNDISCPGAADGSVTFTVEPGPYTWEWLDDPALTSTTRVDLGPSVLVVLVSGGLCPSFITGQLGDPFIDVAGMVAYCPSDPPMLTAFPQWSFEPDLFIWSTGDSTTSINIVPGTTGVISVTGTDTTLGCTIEGEITLTLLPSPTVTFAAPDSVCIGVSALVTTTTSTADSLVWRWETNGLSNEADPMVTFNSPFWQPISLQGFDLFGCGSEPLLDSVFVRPRLPADFTVEQIPCTPMVDLIFSSTSDSCAFFLGDSLILDLCSGFVRRDLRRYQEYEFTFYSTKPDRCDDTTSVRIDIRTEPTLFLPNAFSPDGDGINDLWPGPVDIPEAGFEILLFDRWGSTIWSSNDTQAKWDGGSLPIGVYVYTMQYRDPCQPTDLVSSRGTVTLLR